LVNALITADPLHNKEATVRVILEKGGDYLIGTKAITGALMPSKPLWSPSPLSTQGCREPAPP
jgi:hypothetical protein